MRFYGAYYAQYFPTLMFNFPISQSLPIYYPTTSPQTFYRTFSSAKSAIEYKIDQKTLKKAEKIYSLLPKRNCGACGYSSCYELALAIANRREKSNACRIIGNQIAPQIEKILKEF